MFLSVQETENNFIMKITPIKPVSFGYNAEFHKQLHEKLAQSRQYKELAKDLIEADKFSLGLEDEIIEMEKDPKKYNSRRFELMTDFLCDMKQTIAFHMNYNFPKLNYAESLMFQYTDEANMQTKKPLSVWRGKMIDSLAGLAKVYPDANGEEEKEQQPSKDSLKTDVMQTLDEVGKQAVDNYKDKQSKELLEQYVPNASSTKGFDDVIGIEDVKLKLKENIVDYALHPEQAQKDFEEYGISAPRGFLFYGPPGCGKTFITKALAAESGLEMYKLDVSKAGSKYVNQTSINIQKAFDALKDKAAKNGKPVLLFMDEVDSLAMSRGDVMHSDENMKTVTTLLKLVESAKDNGIIIIAATNKYDLLDEAFKARFDGQVYFPLPDDKEIQSLLKHLLEGRNKGKKLAKSKKELEQLSKMMHGHSSRSITFIVDEASKLAKRRDRDNITFEDVKRAIETTELEKSEEKNYKKASKARVIGFGIH